MNVQKRADLYLFKDGLPTRVVGINLFTIDAKQMSITLTERLTKEQINERYEYVVIERQ